jgi:thiol-disulfide isomerase/thioredoxin
METPLLFIPNLSIPVLLIPEEGRHVSLAVYAGSPLILHFWPSWCPYCKKLHPGLDALAIEYEKSGIVLLGVTNTSDPNDPVLRAFANKAMGAAQ